MTVRLMIFPDTLYDLELGRCVSALAAAVLAAFELFGLLSTLPAAEAFFFPVTEALFFAVIDPILCCSIHALYKQIYQRNLITAFGLSIQIFLRSEGG